LPTLDKPLSKNYTGRFAPSPTGSLHLGSLYTALASFLDARANQGKWLLRIDDIDSFRQHPEAIEGIIEALQVYGLIWDGDIYYQSQHLEQYQAIVSKLLDQQKAYPCICSRKQLAENPSPIYPGYCRAIKRKETIAHAVRIKVKALDVGFDDTLQGEKNYQLDQQIGDFIIKRKDNIFAYQLAVVVDDYLQGVTDVVRGLDLLNSTPKQLYLQKTLSYPHPRYSHVPIIVNSSGQKLSKQTCAQAVSLDNPTQTLYLLLEYLQQYPPRSLKKSSIKRILDWAVEHWNYQQLKYHQVVKLL